MISGYHEAIHRHYEKFPYPDYPLFLRGRWKDLESVDTGTWGVRRPINDIWIAGCGTIAPLMFGRRNYGAKILASDFSSSALKRCQWRLRLFGIRNVLLKQEDLFETHYDEAFDAIDAFGVIHHTISPVRSLQVLAKSLRPGGVMRVMVYSHESRREIEDLKQEITVRNLEKIDEVEKFIAQKMQRPSGDLSHTAGIADALLNPLVHVFTRETLEKLFAEAPELEILKIDDTSNFVVFARKK